MAQLCRDQARFDAVGTSVLVLVPNGPNLLGRTLPEIQPTYPVLMDKGSKVAAVYSGITQNWLNGTPMAFIVDKQGVVRFARVLESQSDELDNEEILTYLAGLD